MSTRTTSEIWDEVSAASRELRDAPADQRHEISARIDALLTEVTEISTPREYEAMLASLG